MQTETEGISRVRIGPRDRLRRAILPARRLLMRTSMPVRFLSVTAAVVALAMAVLGGVLTNRATESVVSGVAMTLAGGDSHTIASYLGDLDDTAPISDN